MVIVAISISVAFFSIWVISGYLPTMNIQTPAYDVMGKKAGYEIRLYKPYVIAEARRDKTSDESSGFRKLFQYISGNNMARSKIKMTAPVLRSEPSETRKIPMSAPVLTYGDGGSSMIAFVMPPGIKIDGLPRPKSEAVQLKVVPAHIVAVITFSGYATDDAIRKNTGNLLTALKRDDRMVRVAPQIALYNPPWTPPFMRKNEIMVELD